MKEINKFEKIVEILRSRRPTRIVPDTGNGKYFPACLDIVESDELKFLWNSMFPKKMTEYLLISSTEVKILQNHYPIAVKTAYEDNTLCIHKKCLEDNKLVKYLIPVEDHLRYGVDPPSPHVILKFPDKQASEFNFTVSIPSIFNTTVNDTIHIEEAQFCPVTNEDRKEFHVFTDSTSMHTYVPIGSLNIKINIEILDVTFTLSELIIMNIDDGSPEYGTYGYTSIYKIDNKHIERMILDPHYLHYNYAEFSYVLYGLFKEILPILAPGLLSMWDAYQWMRLNPEIKECFFTEETTMPIDSSNSSNENTTNSKIIRNNVKYVCIDVSEHHRITSKKKYTRPATQVPVRGYIKTMNGKEVYVGPYVRYKDNPPIEEPIEVKI